MLSARHLTALAVLLPLAAFASPSTAADEPPTVTARTPTVHWKGTIDAPAPMGCGQPNLGCDVTNVVVDARKGSWLTMSVSAESANIRVTTGGRVVGSGGQSLDPNPNGTLKGTTTFQQVASGRVTYQVAVGDQLGSSVRTYKYTGTARLGGTEFDRAGDCGVTSGIERLNDSADGTTKPLGVRLVGEPKDAADIRRAGATLIETYGRIGVPIRMSYDFMKLPPYGNGYPYEGVRRHYGGVRPAGVDVVHVLTDDFAGGIADCLGGIAYPEKAFSVGNVHYTVQGTVPVSQVPAGLIAAHEIGHLLGAQHQQYN